MEKLNFEKLETRAVNVPMTRPLHTSGGAVTSARFILLDLTTTQGVTGHAYVFCYTEWVVAPLISLFQNFSPLLAGDELAPLEMERKFQTLFRLLGPQGLGGHVISGIDMAAWDARARAAGQSLARLLGGAPRPIPAYNSCGLGIIGPEKAGPEAAELAAPGFKAVKVRLGYPKPSDDVAVVRAVRKHIGDDMALMSDYNQSLSVPEAIVRSKALKDEGLYWIEEPTRFDDYLGNGKIRQRSAVPIQLGENCWGPPDMAKALQADACDYFMPDLGKIWGVTGWLKAAAMAGPIGLPISSHLFPEVSAQMLSITPTRHWLEYVDWANPILANPLKIEQGQAITPDRPGSGLEWDEEAVKAYRTH